MRSSYRTIGLSICIGLFYCLGSVLAPWIAILVGNWRTFLLVTSLPFILVPFFYFIVPESVHWLISNQQYDKAVLSLKRVAKTNKQSVDETIFTEFVADCKRQQSHIASVNLFNLFKTPNLRRNTLILFFKSLVKWVKSVVVNF